MNMKNERKEELKQELLNQCADIETIGQMIVGIAYRNKKKQTDEFSTIVNLARCIADKAANMYGLICIGDDEQ